MTTCVERPTEVRDAGYYDDAYHRAGYRHYRQELMYPVWRQAAKFLKALHDPKVLDLGCGTGGLGALLYDAGFTRYNGIDFSPVAVNLARRRLNLPDDDLTFFVEDLTAGRWAARDYDAVVAVEVLEHLADDVGLLRRVRPGARVVFSVPNIKCDGHVRWFGSPGAVVDRYSPVIDIKRQEVFTMGTAKWFVVDAVRRHG